jgi:hypothetical protein
VIANRLWQLHFGRGLVADASDLGQRGGLPTHPELLDWLATELVAGGWSLKKLQRTMLLSNAYRQGAGAPPPTRRIDPGNELLSRMNRRRLSAEEIRDTILKASGALSLKMGGPPVVPPLAPDELFGISTRAEDAWIVTPDPAEHGRRSVYLLRRRGFRQPLMEVFDAPDGNVHCSRREASTSAPQALTLFNGPFTIEQARRLASALEGGVREPVVEAWRRVLSRDPAPDELASARRLVARQAVLLGSRHAALAELGRALFNLNELLHVE